LNWGTNQGSPGLDAAFANTDTARFGSAVSSGTAVILLNGASPSLRTLTFDSVNGTYDLDVGTGGTGRITLAGSGSNGLIDVQAGFHEIHTEVELASNLTVAVAASSGLTLHGDIAGAGFSVTKSGSGLLTLRGNNVYSGGTLITGGTLALGNSGTPLGSGAVVLSNGATLNLQGFTIANLIDAGNGTIVNPGAANIDVSGNTTISGTGPVAGVYTILTGGTGTITTPLGDPSGPSAGTVTVNGGGALVATGTITSFGSVVVNAAGRATLSGPGDGSVTTAGSTTFGGDLLGLGTVLVTGGTTTFQGATFGDVNVGTSGTDTGPKRAFFNGTIAKTAHVYASGTIDILGSVASTGDVKVEAGGVARMLGTGTFGQAALTNNGSFVIDRTAPLTLATAISGSGGLRKLGSAALTLTGTSTFTGLTQVDAGKLVVNGGLGTGGVSVAAGGALAGSGVIAGAIGGGGFIEPGNSPGILTADSLAPTGTTSFAFEFTGTTPPVWSDATASGNDVLRLTDATAPFAGSLGPTNVVSVYFDVASIAGRAEFLGGFFTDRDASFAGLVAGASYVYYVLGDGNGTAITYNGQGYYLIDTWGPANIYDYRGVTRTTVQVASANFASGTVTDGWSTLFIVVPEPDTLLLGGCGIATACGCLFRRRRRPGHASASL
jgi:autotransporter-associated beta strand protein